ncbi:phosphatidylserine synthase [Dysgonomonas sp. PH5-45]|uniref:hypothetical protein n=1 Tax=unclassified Dysgonomonas TaxID=2630389 RepID=UPI002474E3D7|nr:MULTISPECIES: hypothetical protein [unclassified Dysgonomonas]MDH6353837.1 phosphatidylserine synthase [Dysgonomonas sp. PH5-45]MDH6386739.1 phosphatidylserine synthase [Dysgonomonas sp. PH5-37]
MNKQKTKNIIYQIAAIIILASAVIYPHYQDIAKFSMLAGVAAFGAITFTTPYPGKSIRGKRLYNMQIFAVILMVVATFLMFKQMGEWLYALLVAAILILYSSFLLPRILRKEEEGK